MSAITKQTIKHVAQLANIPVSEQESASLAQAFQDTLEVVDKLKKVDVKDVESTHQVTGLTNVTRPDQVIPKQMLSQSQALANAKKTYQGYIVVPRILERD
jgi:aspartyl-tRNA(Asn)/glutamyl-tRNA(Gln) amidotransferase subunit C